MEIERVTCTREWGFGVTWNPRFSSLTITFICWTWDIYSTRK